MNSTTLLWEVQIKIEIRNTEASNSRQCFLRLLVKRLKNQSIWTTYRSRSWTCLTQSIWWNLSRNSSEIVSISKSSGHRAISISALCFLQYAKTHLPVQVRCIWHPRQFQPTIHLLERANAYKSGIREPKKTPMNFPTKVKMMDLPYKSRQESINTHLGSWKISTRTRLRGKKFEEQIVRVALTLWREQKNKLKGAAQITLVAAPFLEI